MSLREFWISVRTGASLIAPTATVDSPKLDAGAIEKLLERTTLWLTPSVVAGFNDADFEFLADDQRAALSRSVEEFRQIASQVPSTAPATPEQIAQALPQFRDIVGMMEFDRYGDDEAYRIGKQIERVISDRRPPQLVELRFNTGTDNTGDPAIWIWAFLSDDEEDAVLGRARELRRLLDSASRSIVPDLIPYISFRSVTEQAELAGG